MADFENKDEEDEFFDSRCDDVVNTGLDNEKIVDEDIINEFQVEKSLETSLAAKEEGNIHFRNKQFDQSIECYSKAIAYCPEDDANKDNLATFFGNRSAAYFAVDEFELTVDDCTSALEIKPDYTKVLFRRMQANEKLDKIDEALADAKKIQEMDSAFPKIGTTVQRLQKLHEEKMNKLKDEALGKLKELGNSILGNFGMSLDNFQMKQDPKTGSWNISMNNNNNKS